MFIFLFFTYSNAETVETNENIEQDSQVIDLTALSYDTLLRLEQDIRLELKTRPEGSVFVLDENAYIVGKDIPEGRYRFEFNGVRTEYNSTTFMGWLVIYDTYAHYIDGYAYNSRKGGGNLVVLTDTNSAECDLNTGYVLIIRVGPVNAEKIGYIEKKEAYSPPSGTTIPVGTYSVGNDVPAGSYTAYYTGGAETELYIYKNEADSKKSYIYAWHSYTLDENNPEVTLQLSEGQYLDIRNANIVMKKFVSFSFD